MTRGWTKLAVLAASLMTFLGACCNLYSGTRIQDLIGCKSGCSSGCKAGGAGKCALSPQALAERKRTVEASLGLKTLERTELDDGVAIRFPTDSETVQAVFDFVVFERSCCDFITFEVLLSGGDGPFWLRLRGDKKAKEFLKDMFGVGVPISGS